MTSHALAISTYVPKNASPEVSLRLIEMLISLDKSSYRGPIIIVDDGSCTDHHNLLRIMAYTFGYKIILREENGGVAKTKNTCIRAIIKLGVDVGFLADDDLEFSSCWWKPYINAYEMTNIQHFSWINDDDPGYTYKYPYYNHGYELSSSDYLNGAFLTFTPEVIKKVGGMKILPAKWGHEHTNWTKRIVKARLAPCWCDVVDSNKYICLNSLSLKVSSVTQEHKLVGAAKNLLPSQRLKPLYCELEE